VVEVAGRVDRVLGQPRAARHVPQRAPDLAAQRDGPLRDRVVVRRGQPGRHLLEERVGGHRAEAARVRAAARRLHRVGVM
jgi:hypothetical protein